MWPGWSRTVHFWQQPTAHSVAVFYNRISGLKEGLQFLERAEFVWLSKMCILISQMCLIALELKLSGELPGFAPLVLAVVTSV